MENLKEKQLKVLNDTVNHFNKGNRSVSNVHNNSSGCWYAPQNDTTTGCAIGRLIEDKSICRILDKRGAYISEENAFDLLPAELQALGQGFLINLQQLHDYGGNWNQTGLSEEGKREVEIIKNRYELN